MAISRTIQDYRGFTTTHFGRCCVCSKPLEPLHATCACGVDILPVQLQPKQAQLLDYILATGPNVPTKIGGGGSRAAGKSRGGRDIALVTASEVSQACPGIVIFIVRRNWGDLEENHVEKLKLERPTLAKLYSSKEFTFPTSRLVFRYGDTFDDIRRVGRGPEGYLIIVDQAEQFSEAELYELRKPNRWPAAGPGGAKTLYLFNPGGAGSAYLQRVFFKRKYEDNEDPSDYAFVHAFGWDNYHGWFQNHNIVVDGEPLTFEKFYTLPGDLPPCPGGKYNRAWLDSIDPRHRFHIFVTQTTEGKKMWGMPESTRIGDLFGRFDQFEGQAFAGVWEPNKVVLQ